jgi:hypothetical protein
MKETLINELLNQVQQYFEWTDNTEPFETDFKNKLIKIWFDVDIYELQESINYYKYLNLKRSTGYAI